MGETIKHQSLLNDINMIKNKWSRVKQENPELIKRNQDELIRGQRKNIYS